MNLKKIKASMFVLSMLGTQSAYGVSSAFTEALRLAVHGDQKEAVRTIVDGGQSHCLQVIDSTKELGPDKIVDIDCAKFYVPNFPVDLIQSVIVNYRTFFEIQLLRELQPYTSKSTVILDIGANIGNHSIYWAINTNASKIYSFEPVRDTFAILKKNIEINKLTDKVKIFNIGLSNKKINASISSFDPKNIGGTSIKQDLTGDLLLNKLDNIEIEENAVDFVKIDVEGHELKVFQGARETLIRYKPTIFVESFPDNHPKVHEYLTNLGYRLEKSFEAHNYLYIFDYKE